MLNTVISGWLLCGLEVGDSHTLIPTTMWWLISVDWCFLSSTLQLLPLSFSPLHPSNGFPHQWQLGHNWLVTSLRQICLVLCPILTQKSPTFSSHLSRKMDGSSLTPLPCCSPLSSHWLRKRQYLVSQPRWGEHFVPERRSLPESDKSTSDQDQATTPPKNPQRSPLVVFAWAA